MTDDVSLATKPESPTAFPAATGQQILVPSLPLAVCTTFVTSLQVSPVALMLARTVVTRSVRQQESGI